MDSSYHRSKRRRLQSGSTSDAETLQCPAGPQNPLFQVAYPVSDHQVVSWPQSRDINNPGDLPEDFLQASFEGEAYSQPAAQNHGNDELETALSSREHLLGHSSHEHELAPREYNEIITSLCPSQPEAQNGVCEPEELVCFGMVRDVHGTELDIGAKTIAH